MDTPDTLAASLLKASGAVVVGSRAVVQQSAKKIKDEARANVLRSAPTRNAGAQDAIGYETKYGKTTVDAVIGYDKRKPGGALGNLLEFGGGGDHSPPHRDLGRALDAEEPRFLNALNAMAKGLLR